MDGSGVLRWATVTLLVTAIFAGALAHAEDAPVVTILSTDLSMDRDPDDWFDLFMFCSLDALHPAGVILEHYATDAVEDETHRFLRILDKSNLPVVRGIQTKLTGTRENPQAGQYLDGARLILDTMRSAKGKVRLIAVGSLRNEAIAYSTEPELFESKIDAVYFLGGTLDGRKETNLNRDTLAADIALNASFPIVWVPGTAEHKQKLSGADEARIRAMDHPVAQFLTDKLVVWRKFRGNAWLERTEQMPGQGKNLWSLPAFLHAAGIGADWMHFDSGILTYDGQSTISFIPQASGRDIMLIRRDDRKIISFLLELLAENRASN